MIKDIMLKQDGITYVVTTKVKDEQILISVIDRDTSKIYLAKKFANDFEAMSFVTKIMKNGFTTNTKNRE